MIDPNNPLLTGEAMDFEQFQRNNRFKVNHALNHVLWFCILAGPAIALGVLGGVFKQTSYAACAILSAVMFVVAGTNSILLKKKPYSYGPGVFALIAVSCLLCFMNVSHISIRLTWFLVPFLSLLFCDTKVYVATSVMNYAVMAIGTWLESTHYAEIRTDFATPLAGFINIFAGCTIEAAVMFAAGLALGRATGNYYRSMIGQFVETQTQKETLQEQLGILDSMAEIYDFVNLIDFKESTEMSLREETLRKRTIEPGQDHTHMTQGLRPTIIPDMVDDFWRFTDITTVPVRLINRKSIAGEFISSESGWFRAQYIRVAGKIDQKPDVVIYTIQNIDSDKRREEQLIRISRTDELTRLFNRHCYEKDMETLRENGLDDDLAVISVDVNGLKTANDTKGHAAGDELLRGAAACLLSAVGAFGTVYRTGGDEFIAIVRTDDCGKLADAIRSQAAAWHGRLVDSLSLSIGYSTHAEQRDARIEELETLADKRMYADKALYYQQSGHDRRQG
jgi:diguanylate cyclase (GGDEF)-like protein